MSRRKTQRRRQQESIRRSGDLCCVSETSLWPRAFKDVQAQRFKNNGTLAEIPENVKGALEIVPVGMVDEALSCALIREPVPTALAASTTSDGPSVAAADNKENKNDIVAH